MKFAIKTVYGRGDIEGFYEAFLAGKKPVRTAKKATKLITTVIAAVFWALAAFIFVVQLTTGDVKIILSGLPMVAIFALLGLWIFFMGRKTFRSKASWRAYPNKGEELAFVFEDDVFTLTQKMKRQRQTMRALSAYMRMGSGSICSTRPRRHISCPSGILPRRKLPRSGRLSRLLPACRWRAIDLKEQIRLLSTFCAFMTGNRRNRQAPA